MWKDSAPPKKNVIPSCLVGLFLSITFHRQATKYFILSQEILKPLQNQSTFLSIPYPEDYRLQYYTTIMADISNHDELISQFCAITNASPSEV